MCRPAVCRFIGVHPCAILHHHQLIPHFETPVPCIVGSPYGHKYVRSLQLRQELIGQLGPSFTGTAVPHRCMIWARTKWFPIFCSATMVALGGRGTAESSVPSMGTQLGNQRGSCAGGTPIQKQQPTRTDDHRWSARHCG